MTFYKSYNLNFLTITHPFDLWFYLVSCNLSQCNTGTVVLFPQQPSELYLQEPPNHVDASSEDAQVPHFLEMPATKNGVTPFLCTSLSSNLCLKVYQLKLGMLAHAWLISF